MSFFIGFLNVLSVVSSIFLICLILIQRGKGGGLAGAFGGAGGSSAFGTKAGDVFTRVTIGVATVWIVLSMLLVVINNQPRESAFQAAGSSASDLAAPKSTGDSKASLPPTSTPPPIDKAVPKAPASDLPPALPNDPGKTP